MHDLTDDHLSDHHLSDDHLTDDHLTDDDLTEGHRASEGRTGDGPADDDVGPDAAGPDAAAGTTERLISAAEHLFAIHGIDGVSLREINRAAGARNASALQYHFRDRDGLLKALMVKHGREVEARRHAVLDTYEAEGRDDLRALAGALVRPMAAKLSDPDGGPQYLQIMADLMNRPRPPFDPGAPDDPTSSIDRWRRLVAPLLADDATRLHRRFAAIRIAVVELGRRARSGPRSDERLFVSDLVDIVVGVLAAPVTDETRRLATSRRRTGGAVRR